MARPHLLVVLELDAVSRRAIQHSKVSAAAAEFHVAQIGDGLLLVLLHGWPEFWLTWEPVMQRSAGRHRLIAPDLRGFGESSKPMRDWGAEDHAKDMLALLDARDVDCVGLVCYDIGAAVMQALARIAPDRFIGLFFFDFVYPGIGARLTEPPHLKEMWQLSFHRTELAPRLFEHDPVTCRLYIDHFLQHWSHRKHAFDDVLESWIESFMQPGNLEGDFAYYRAAEADHNALTSGHAPKLEPIAIPTCVRWPGCDPLFPFDWTDRLAETFTDLDLAPMTDVGHFPDREDPDGAAREVDAFFARLAGQRPTALSTSDLEVR